MAGRARARVLDLSDRQPPILGREPLPPPRPGLMDDPRMFPPPHHLPGPHHPSFLLEERLAAQHREIHELLHDNQRLAAVHVALRQEVDLAQHEVQLAAASATQANVEKDAHARAAYEKSLALEAEARMVERDREELAAVRSDLRELHAAKAELGERMQGLKSELARARDKMQQVPAILSEIDTMQVELQRGRGAIEYEKRARATNVQQSREMEKNMMSMANELEKLRAELADAEKRARAAAAAGTVSKPGAAGYAGYGNSELAQQTGGASYANAYGMQQGQSGAAPGGSYQGQGGGGGGSYQGQGGGGGGSYQGQGGGGSGSGGGGSYQGQGGGGGGSYQGQGGGSASYPQYWSGNTAANSQYQHNNS